MSVEKKVQKVIDEQINPMLEVHNGGVKLVKFEDGMAHLIMIGGCTGCAGARFTLKSGIENLLMEEIPAVEGVIDVTDHSMGTSPFYPDAFDIEDKSFDL